MQGGCPPPQIGVLPPPNRTQPPLKAAVPPPRSFPHIVFCISGFPPPQQALFHPGEVEGGLGGVVQRGGARSITLVMKLTMALAGCSGSSSANRWHALPPAPPACLATNPKILGGEKKEGTHSTQGGTK